MSSYFIYIYADHGIYAGVAVYLQGGGAARAGGGEESRGVQHLPPLPQDVQTTHRPAQSDQIKEDRFGFQQENI